MKFSQLICSIFFSFQWTPNRIKSKQCTSVHLSFWEKKLENFGMTISYPCHDGFVWLAGWFCLFVCFKFTTVYIVKGSFKVKEGKTSLCWKETHFVVRNVFEIMSRASSAYKQKKNTGNDYGLSSRKKNFSRQKER